jgi:hypothetical protein
MQLETLQAWDEIILTGTASSPAGRRYVDLRCTVATVSKEPAAAIKVWPEGGGDDEDGGKIWFELTAIESVRLEKEAP